MSPTFLSGRKPGSASPNSVHDYELLAIFVANGSLAPSLVSNLRGFDDDYLDRLLRSASGRACHQWLSNLPTDLLKELHGAAFVGLGARRARWKSHLRR